MLKLIAKAHARFMRDDKGATAIEYGLIAVGISVVVFAFGDQLVALFEDMGAELENRPS
jgi:Flp pilus assembly pilin Flp